MALNDGKHLRLCILGSLGLGFFRQSWATELMGIRLLRFKLRVYFPNFILTSEIGIQKLKPLTYRQDLSGKMPEKLKNQGYNSKKHLLRSQFH